MTKLGYLVMINGTPLVITPDTNPVIKNGKKQFWFYINGKALLATQQPNNIYFKVQ